MAQRVRIECVNKSNRTNAHERIASIGGRNQDGTRWKMAQDRAVAKVNDRTYTFFVERPPGHVAEVIVARSAHGHEYLKTVADGEHPNNLLALPECPP